MTESDKTKWAAGLSIYCFVTLLNFKHKKTWF